MIFSPHLSQCWSKRRNESERLNKFSRLELQAIGPLLTLLSTGERENTRHSPLLTPSLALGYLFNIPLSDFTLSPLPRYTRIKTIEEAKKSIKLDQKILKYRRRRCKYWRRENINQICIWNQNQNPSGMCSIGIYRMEVTIILYEYIC